MGKPRPPFNSAGGPPRFGQQGGADYNGQQQQKYNKFENYKQYNTEKDASGSDVFQGVKSFSSNQMGNRHFNNSNRYGEHQNDAQSPVVHAQQAPPPQQAFVQADAIDGGAQPFDSNMIQGYRMMNGQIPPFPPAFGE
jgi:hypothetical protein